MVQKWKWSVECHWISTPSNDRLTDGTTQIVVADEPFHLFIFKYACSITMHRKIKIENLFNELFMFDFYFGFILTFQANHAVSLNVAHPPFLNGGRARTQS